LEFAAAYSGGVLQRQDEHIRVFRDERGRGVRIYEQEKTNGSDGVSAASRI
jgi:hypothetical protein